MNWLRVSILLILLPFVSLAQQPGNIKVDRIPSFVENGYWFGDYVRFHPKQPLDVKKDTSFTVKITIHTDTNGIGTVGSIEPKVDTSVYNEFVKIVNDAPQWTPALIKYQPVAYDEVFAFDVTLIKAKSQMIIKFHKDQPVKKESADGDKEFESISRAADFPGGQKAWAAFLKANIQYPQPAKQKHTQGWVWLQFIVERDGSLTAMKIVHDPGDGLGKEALRVLQLSPKWLMGVEGGYKVRIQKLIPVKFSL